MMRQAQEFAEIIDGKYGSYDLTPNYGDNFDVAHENNIESILEIQFLGDVENNAFNRYGNFRFGI